MLNDKAEVDSDSINKMNLLMLLEAKTNNDTKKIKQLKSTSEDITTKVVARTQLPANNTIVFGNSLYSGQIYTSNDTSLSIDNALKNHLPIYNMTECENKLTAVYNL